MEADFINVLALDPSLRNTGYIVAKLSANEITYIDSGVITTKPNKYSTDMLLKDSFELYTAVNTLLHDIDYVCSEASVFSQSAQNAVVNGIVIGLLTAVMDKKPVHVVSQSQAKQATQLEFEGKDSKEVVMAWACAHLPDHLIPRYRGKINKTQFNHIADAVAVLHASLPTLRKSLCK